MGRPGVVRRIATVASSLANRLWLAHCGIQLPAHLWRTCKTCQRTPATVLATGGAR